VRPIFTFACDIPAAFGGGEAGQLFEQDLKPVQVTHQLRVSAKSACQWRRR
jgi:hypothetical protein